MLADLRKSLYEVPLNQTFGVVPVIVGPGDVSLELRHRPSLLDHAGALHTASLFGVAELAAGVVLATHPDLERVEFRRTATTIRYVGSCFGDVVARATVSDETLEQILGGTPEVVVPVRVLDAVDNDVALVECGFVAGRIVDR